MSKQASRVEAEIPESAVIAQSPRMIPDVLRRLRAITPPAGGVLSAFVDMSLERSIGGAYRTAFRERIDSLRADLPQESHHQFNAAAVQAEAVITRLFVPGRPGLAVFASGEDTYLFAVRLPERPIDSVHFAGYPILSPLEAAADDAERAVVLLFDKERARLFTIFLGEIEERHDLVDDVPGKQATGDWFGLYQKRYARHHEDHVLRHAKRTIAALLSELQRRPFDRLLVGGPAEAVALLEDHLPRPLRHRFVGSLALELFATEAEILGAARPALKVIERQEEAEAIQRLVADAGSPRVTLGPDATLPALSEGRVHQLFVLSSFLGTARECPGCGRLTPRENPCTRCGTATREIADLRERAVDLAIQGGARVELVSPETTESVSLHGGIAARTRWA